MRVHWVAVPKALRARRVNNRLIADGSDDSAGLAGQQVAGGACAAASYLLGSAGAASTGRAGAVGAAGAGSSIHRPGGGGPALCVALGAAAAPAGRFRAGRAKGDV
jgi:hypothetical protein